MAYQNDTADMRPFYFVPDRCSNALSDRSGSVYFQLGRELPEDINLRYLCNMACRLLQTGKSWRQILIDLKVEDEERLYEMFTSYMRVTPENYALWCMNHQKK